MAHTHRKRETPGLWIRFFLLFVSRIVDRTSYQCRSCGVRQPPRALPFLPPKTGDEGKRMEEEAGGQGAGCRAVQSQIPVPTLLVVAAVSTRPSMFAGNRRRRRLE